MNRATKFLGLFATIAIIAVIAAAQAGGDKGGASGGMGSMPPEMQAGMERWMKISTPGQEHAKMAAMAGEWTAQTTMWSPFGGEPAKGTGSAKFEMALGGHYMIQHFKGSTPWGPFEGMGISGYDIQKGEYFNVWIDSMGTALMISTNKGDDDPSMGEYYCPFHDDTRTSKQVVKYDGGDTMTFEMWAAKAGTEEFEQTMEIVYTRKK